MKKSAEEIRVVMFWPSKSEDLVSTFDLIYYGLHIQNCGAFFTRNGKLSFQLPYGADFNLPAKESYEISKKLAIALERSKHRKDSADELPFLEG